MCTDYTVLRGHRVNRTYGQVPQHIPSSISRAKSCALPDPEVLLCVSLGLIVASACKSRLTSGVTSPGFTRAGGTPPKITKIQIQKTVTRAHENTKYNNTYMYKFQKQTREIQMDPKIHIAGGRSGQIREGCFFARGLVCASTTRSGLRDKTMFQMVPNTRFDPFS